MANLGVVLPNGSIRLTDLNREWKRILQSDEQKQLLASKDLAWVTSSCISAIGVDNGNLRVRFHSGYVYTYPQLGNLFDKFLASNSKGRYFNRNVRKYGYSKKELISFGNEPLSEQDVFDILESKYIKELFGALQTPISAESVTIKGIDMIKYTSGLLQIYRPTSL
jgi:hypothetical protein